MKILITDPISETGKAVLQNSGFEVIDLSAGSSKTLEKVLPDISGWIVRSETKILKGHLTTAKNLKVIGRAGVGIDNVDVKSATLHGIVVMNTPTANIISAAEHTIALILSFARNIHTGHASLQSKKWERESLVGIELKGKTVGIVGLGKIGTEVAKRLRAFGMKIVGNDPYVTPDHFELDYVEFLSLDELCKVSDIITLHVPKIETTAGLINLEKLKLMKPTAIIANCARGGIIVEKDLAEALNKGIIAGAALDVFETEPPLDSPVLTAKNILLTPHLGASTLEAKEEVSKTICEQVRNFLLEGKLENALNIPIADFSLLQSLQSYISLSEKLGLMHQQLTTEPAKSITVETQGTLKDVKLVTLGFLKGFLEQIHGSTVNFVNALALAESHGIQVHEIYSYGESDYSNLISATVTYGKRTLTIRASLFSERHPRVIYFDGYHLDLTPTGNLLIIYNQDVPGVVGKVGTFLGNQGTNIATYQLSQKDDSKEAMGIIRLDIPLDRSGLEELTTIKEIIRAYQLILE